MKTVKFFMFMIALFCSTLSPAKAEISTNILLDVCNEDTETSQRLCLLYITGSIEGMRWGAGIAAFQSGITEAQAMRDSADTFLAVCTPQAAIGTQLYEVVLQYMRNNPKVWHEPAVAVIHRALIEAFPCQ